MKETRKRGIRATEEGRKKLTTAKAAKRNHNDKVWTYLDIATAAEVNETTVKRFFRGEAVDRESAISICKALGLEVTDIVDANDLNPPTSKLTPTEIDWRDICDKVVATQQLRRQATAQQYELNIYVPLGLMERPKTPNPIPNPTGEESRQKEPELQIVQTYKDEAFFQKVIAENRTEKGKHIAIVGEPGAGKTTLLGELAERLPKNSPDFPICIRLADLRESTIEDYLLDNWLKKALYFIDADAENVTPGIRKALKQLFCQGKVWLLLDAVDEMAAESPVQALAKIREQLTDWVGKARVVLTCRLNVWDAAISNTLTSFDTYKTLEFEPDDVDEFIRQWFEEASQDEKRRNSDNENFWREQGKRLTRQLKEPGKERIKELVRNPLRLSMLCQSWCVPEQELPETKAALYEQFTTYFFEWKQEEFQKKHRVLKETDKKQIQQALAKLALAAMESANRFRIEQEFAIEQMGEEWFDLADELGWLVLVDRDTRTKKPVYAFYHPTFQEYFAACAIADWHFFLNHVPENPKQGIYRIFEKQWKEVILLWLGRGEIEPKPKQEFIDALVKFEDGCGCFYNYQAFLMAAKGIAEFDNYDSALEIIKQIVQWSFGYLSVELNQWLTDVYPQIRDAAKQILREINHSLVIPQLINLLNTPNEYRCIEVADSLGKVVPGHPKAVESLINLIKTCSIPGVRMKAVIVLANIGKDNQETITHLVDLIHSSPDDPLVRSIAAQCVGKIDSNHPDAILLTVTVPNSFEESSESKKMETNSEDKIKSLISQICTTSDEPINFEVIQDLRHIIKLHLKSAVSALKEALPVQLNDEKDFKLHKICWEFLWQCSENLSYPDFYQAWHPDTLTDSATASLNLANLPQILAEAINDRPDLCSKVKLICIDTHQFIDPDNPAQEIYDEILNQNCPEWQNGYPDTMQKLKLYWNSLRRQSEIPLFFICYDSTALSATPTGFNDSFLKALSKFDRAICVVCEQGNIPLPTFSPSQPDLVAAVVAWIRRSILENRHPI
ncbi:HEAT repeat domain-containing protein [Microcoleus sp. AR_TQ3_B6]|uniref:NACHT C-terminal alpha/beta 1 domain-containing protein n=1 Tax=Microcoleus sp. AR_TQ3_B6 TaxID=3055284 RepID=UPI002FD25B38